MPHSNTIQARLSLHWFAVIQDIIQRLEFVDVTGSPLRGGDLRIRCNLDLLRHLRAKPE